MPCYTKFWNATCDTIVARLLQQSNSVSIHYAKSNEACQCGMYTSFSKKRGRNEKEFFFFACTTIFQIQYTEISFANLVVFLSPPYSRNECEYNRTKIIRVFVGKNCGQVRQSRWSIALVKQYSAPLMYFIVPSKRYPHRSFLSPCHGTMSDRVWRFNREFTIAFDSSPWHRFAARS